MRMKEGNNRKVIILDRGEEIIPALEKIAEENELYGFFFGIGAVSDPEIAYFDRENSEYLTKKLKGEFEVVSLLGNVSSHEGDTAVHAHISLGDGSYQIRGGHLVKGTVAVTLELLLLQTPKPVRTRDKETGLDLIKSFSTDSR